MKKLFSLILVLLMTLTLVPFTGTAAEDENINDFFDTLGGNEGGEISVEIDEDADLSYLNLLVELGIIDEADAVPENVFKTVSRAKTVRHILKLLGYDDAIISENAIEGYYTDVTALTPYASEIEFATKRGIVAGYPDGTFRPNDQINYNEVLKLVIAALGYTPQAEANGGYYAGYFLTAHSLKLTKNAPQQEVNIFGTVARIIYNALNVKTLSGTYSITDVEYKKNDTTVLNDVFDSEAYTGIVESVGKNSIYGYADQGEDIISISGQLYRCTVENPLDYIGRKVRFYVTEDSESAYYKVFNMEIMPVNTVTSFDIDDVTDPEDDRIYYTDENDKKKDIKIGSAYILYNGRGMKYDKEMVVPVQSETGIPMEGDVTCIDNDGDNKADVVIINSYWSFYADSVIAKQGMVSDYYYTQFDPDNKYYYFVKKGEEGNNEQYIYKNGKEVTLADIKSKNVVSVQKSSNGISDIYTLTVTDNKLTGTVSSIESDGTVVVGDKEYELSEYYKYINEVSGGQYAPDFKLGDTIEVYLDMFGKITGCSSITSKKTGDYYYMFGFDASRNSLELEVMNNVGTMETIVIDGEIKYKGRNDSVAEKVSVSVIKNEWETLGYLNAPIRVLLDSAGKATYLEVVNLIPIPSAEVNQGNIVINDISSEYTGGVFDSADVLTVSGKTTKFAIGFGAPGAAWDETNKRAENYNLPVFEEYSYKMTANLTATNSYANTNTVISYIDMVYVADYDPSTGEIGMLIVDSLPNDEYHNAVFSNSANNAAEMGRKYPTISSFASQSTYSNPAATTANIRFFGEWVRFDMRDSRSTRLLMVNKVIETVNEDGDRVQTIIGISDGKEVQMDVRPDCIFWSTTTRTAASTWFEPVDIYNKENNALLANRYYKDFNGELPEIVPGDVYAYIKKMDGSIQELYYVANMDEGPGVYGTDPDAAPVAKHAVSFAGNMKWGFCFGAVHGIDGNNLFLRDRSNSTAKGSFTYSIQDGVDVQNFTINANALYMWDFEAQEFIVANKNEHLIPSYMTYNELPENKYSGGSKKGQKAENNVWMIVANQHWKEQIEMIFADYYDAERYYED